MSVHKDKYGRQQRAIKKLLKNTQPIIDPVDELRMQDIQLSDKARELLQIAEDMKYRVWEIYSQDNIFDIDIIIVAYAPSQEYSAFSGIIEAIAARKVMKNPDVVLRTLDLDTPSSISGLNVKVNDNQELYMKTAEAEEMIKRRGREMLSAIKLYDKEIALSHYDRFLRKYVLYSEKRLKEVLVPGIIEHSSNKTICQLMSVKDMVLWNMERDLAKKRSYIILLPKVQNNALK